uniref:Uncharacterized protein n=1 Tax=Anopheles maculatus TaxID=74869 RepID=A0A182SQA1_9DIPT
MCWHSSLGCREAATGWLGRADSLFGWLTSWLYAPEEYTHESPVSGGQRYTSPKTGGALYQPEPYYDSPGGSWYPSSSSGAYAPHSGTGGYHNVGHSAHLGGGAGGGPQHNHDQYAMSPVGVPHMDGSHLSQGQNSPAIYNAIAAGHHNQHAQHSPIVQNDTLVGKALQTVRIYYTRASGATGGGGGGGGGPTSVSVTSAATAAAVAAAGGTWQQINPVINSNGGGPAVLNSLSNGSYAPELVHRGLPHMVNMFFLLTNCCKLLSSFYVSFCDHFSC